MRNKQPLPKKRRLRMKKRCAADYTEKKKLRTAFSGNVLHSHKGGVPRQVGVQPSRRGGGEKRPKSEKCGGERLLLPSEEGPLAHKRRTRVAFWCEKKKGRLSPREEPEAVHLSIYLDRASGGNHGGGPLLKNGKNGKNEKGSCLESNYF